MIFDQLKSYWTILQIAIIKTIDNLHRILFGMPQLNRCQITANLFLGSQYNLVGLQKLKALGVTVIVNMRIHSIYEDEHYQGFKYLHLPTYDNTPPKLDDLIKGAEFVNTEIKNGGKAYIHCREGLGRGPTMTIAYLMRIGTTYNDAVDLIKKVRPFINPRPLQIEGLKELEIYYHQQREKGLLT